MQAVVAYKAAGAAPSPTVVAQAEASSVTAQTSLATSTPLIAQAGDAFFAVVASTAPARPMLADTAGDPIACGADITPQDGFYLYGCYVMGGKASSTETFTASGTNIFGIAVLQVRGLVTGPFFPPAPSRPMGDVLALSDNPQAAPGSAVDAITSGGWMASYQPALAIGFTASPGESGLAVNAAPNAGTGFTAEPTGVWSAWGGGAGDYLGVFETKELTSAADSFQATFTAPTLGAGNYGTFLWVIPELQQGSQFRHANAPRNTRLDHRNTHPQINVHAQLASRRRAASVAQE